MEIESRPNIISFDVETTGFKAEWENIIELGSVKSNCNGKIIDTFSRFANPGKKIPNKITDITGITDDMVKDAESSNKVILDWFSWVEPGSILLAHNSSFDVSFVIKPLLRLEIDWPKYIVVDTLAWARKTFPNLKKHKLGVLLEHIGYVPKGQLHRAVEDATGTLHLAARMMRECKITTIDDMFAKFHSIGCVMNKI